jgi:ferredoxin-NADP reductase/predicted pyridoxine 5'-phosphate oxidase superfamily flavin-nucleotide-binding protein
MPHAFAEIAFTPNVRAAQTRNGSREANHDLEQASDVGSVLTAREAEFIAARDSFYQATVSETGWPYVQHRGGPAGFLKVLDAHTIGFADFRGNRQYVSVGNLVANDRISLILMDYANRRRLKILGRVRVVEEPDNPELVARLEVPAYRARVERGLVIRVEAYDWNCPQHITPRYSEAEISHLLEPLAEENRKLKAQLAAAGSAPPAILGDGPLSLVITGVRQLTPRVRAYELRDAEGRELPPFEPGAHLRVPVRLADGRGEMRHYSIASDPARRDAYEIAVLREKSGAGGSDAVHALFQTGLMLRCGFPENRFRLEEGIEPVILIAGGIGITPLKAMAHVLAAQDRPFHLHYAARSRGDMAYGDTLARALPGRVTAYCSDRGERMDLDRVVRSASGTALIYACGPERLIAAVKVAVDKAGFDAARVRFERFSVATGVQDRPVEVELRRSGKIITVPENQSILDGVRAAGVPALYECRAGTCGTCAVRVIDGEPEHRDAALTDAERHRGRKMCICVSRARSARLVLDM